MQWKRIIKMIYIVLYNVVELLETKYGGCVMVQVKILVDDNIKREAEKIFDDIGISMSTAINIYLKAVVRENRIPFELSADPFYSDANMSRLRESIRQVRDGENELTEHEIENK